MKTRHFLACLLLAAGMVTAEAAPPRYLDRIIEREGIQMHVRMEALENGAAVTPQVISIYTTFPKNF